MAGDSYRRIEAVTKTGYIMKYLGNQRTPVPAQDIARAVGLPLGTAMCHLVSLAEHGFVRQVSDGWELGLGLALLWARVKSNLEGQRDRINKDIESLTIPGGN